MTLQAGTAQPATVVAGAAGDLGGRIVHHLVKHGVATSGVTSPSGPTEPTSRSPRPHDTFPAWQGMRYTQDMLSGQARLEPLDNSRYPDIEWTSLREYLTTTGVPGNRSDRD